jgi:hypothetical protein
MQDYTINVANIEALQMTNDVQELDIIFQKAKSAIVCGAEVLIVRKDALGNGTPFDKITTLPDLNAYKNTVYKYLKTDQ